MVTKKTASISILRIFSVLFFLYLNACTSSTSNTNSESSLDMPAHQQYKEKILNDFESKPAQAKSFYLNEWTAKRSEREQAQSTSPERVKWLAIAGALIKADPIHYNEYYGYISSNIGSNDWEVAASAVTALSGAKGTQSIDLITGLIADPREFVSADAVLAIDYRLKTAFYESSMRSEYEYAVSRMKSICKSSIEARDLDRVCVENKIK